MVKSASWKTETLKGKWYPQKPTMFDFRSLEVSDVGYKIWFDAKTRLRVGLHVQAMWWFTSNKFLMFITSANIVMTEKQAFNALVAIVEYAGAKIRLLMHISIDKIHQQINKLLCFIVFPFKRFNSHLVFSYLVRYCGRNIKLWDFSF